MTRPPNTFTPRSCSCGCGHITTWYHGKPRRFINGHGRRNGIGYRRLGYVLIRIPEHHYAQAGGYVSRNRLVYEEAYNCCLLPWCIIHHKNGIKDDDRPDNLIPLMRPVHAKLHLTKVPKKDMSDRICSICNGEKTYMRILPSGFRRPLWHTCEKGFACHICYCKQYHKSK